MSRTRCFGSGDPLYENYHDEEWGRQVTDSEDERELFERLALEGFLAGLSWITILRKREEFRRAFEGFVPERVAAFDQDDVERLLGNAGIIRNRAKIQATIGNARALLALHAEGRKLRDVLAHHLPATEAVGARPVAEAPSSTPGATELSKELKKLGFRFVGPITLYSMWQAIGMVDDHLADCWLVTEGVIPLER